MPLDSVVAADLLARILTDERFRARFRRDPVATCRDLGLDDVADELARETQRAFQTLEVRESRSSLAGVLLAAAAEGVGVAELVQTSARRRRRTLAGRNAARARRPVRADRAPGGADRAAGGADRAPVEPTASPVSRPVPGGADRAAGGADRAAGEAGRGAPLVAVAESPAPEPPLEPPAPVVDPRSVPVLARLAGRYDIGITSVTSEGGVSRVVIGSVNGAPVSPTNVDARDLAQEMAALDPSSRPRRVGTPWQIAGEGFVTDPELRDRIEVELPPAPATPAPLPRPAFAAAAPPAPNADPASAGRASAVFGAVGHERSVGRASAVFGAVAPAADAPPAPPADAARAARAGPGARRLPRRGGRCPPGRGGRPRRSGGRADRSGAHDQHERGRQAPRLGVPGRRRRGRPGAERKHARGLRLLREGERADPLAHLRRGRRGARVARYLRPDLRRHGQGARRGREGLGLPARHAGVRHRRPEGRGGHADRRS